jgi:uncharacterized protein YheU (UPF0270 family)
VIEIPLNELSADALQGVLEEYVSRDGTDYGELELSLQQKTQRLLQQWQRKEVVLVFDNDTESTSFLNREEWQRILNAN